MNEVQEHQEDEGRGEVAEEKNEEGTQERANEAEKWMARGNGKAPEARGRGVHGQEGGNLPAQGRKESPGNGRKWKTREWAKKPKMG